MKVFVAGGSGAVGWRLTARLISDGYTVSAMTRHQRHAVRLRAIGAQPVIADALDRDAVLRAVTDARPEVVVHQLSALAGARSLKRFDREFALTNRLRTEATDHLLAGAVQAGSRRIVAQSYGNWNYARGGTTLKTELDPFDEHPPAWQVQTLAALRYLEQTILCAPEIEGLVLRYGNFYGPGTGFSLGGDIVEQVRRRRLPIIGDGRGVWSFIHVDDAADATVAAIERGAPGVYNVVDDGPAPVRDWLPELASILGANPPRHIPVWLGRVAAGEVGVSMMTQIRGTSNAKAVRELGWRPHYPSYREGFRLGLGEVPVPGFGPLPTRS